MSQGYPPNAGQALWLSCVDQLAQELPEQQFNTWIKPLVASASEDLSRVTLFVGNRFKLDWIRAQYASQIAAILERLYGQAIRVELAITPRENVSINANYASSTGPFVAPEAGVAVEDNGQNGFKNRLNTALSFETLVEGTANRMARAAAMHVASSPGQLYNPLFIYGGVGLGKTHLVHA
ncbi:MAG: DnaA/Hda family protein, partial [Betaproteobacteria bacterium]